MFKVHSGLNGKRHSETHRCVQWPHANNTKGETEALRWHPKCKQGQLPWRSLTRRGLLELCKVPEDIRMLRQKGAYWGRMVWNATTLDFMTSQPALTMLLWRPAHGWLKARASLFFLCFSFSSWLLLFPLPECLLVGRELQPVIKWFLQTMKHKGIAESLLGLFRSKRPAIFLDSDRVANLT